MEVKSSRTPANACGSGRCWGILVSTMHARELELRDPKLHFHTCALVVVNSMQTRAVHERMRLRAARCAAHVARTSTLFLQREGHGCNFLPCSFYVLVVFFPFLSPALSDVQHYTTDACGCIARQSDASASAVSAINVRSINKKSKKNQYNVELL